MSALRHAALLASLAFCACGPVTQLDEMSSDELEVQVFVFPEMDDPTGLEIYAILQTDDGECISLDSFAGSLDGRAPDLIERGGTNSTGCWAPNLTFHVHADQRVAPSTLTLGDGTRAITVDLSDRLVPRTAVLVAPADSVVRPGAPLVFDWSSTTDRTIGDFVLFLDRPGDGGGWAGAADARPTVRGEQVVVDAPATLPTSGPGLARLVMADEWSEGGIALPCNDATCSLRAWYEVVLPITYAR